MGFLFIQCIMYEYIYHLCSQNLDNESFQHFGRLLLFYFCFSVILFGKRLMIVVLCIIEFFFFGVWGFGSLRFFYGTLCFYGSYFPEYNKKKVSLLWKMGSAFSQLIKKYIKEKKLVLLYYYP